MGNLPKDTPVIATDKAKWDPSYQKKIGLKTGPAKLDERLAAAIGRTSKRIYRMLNLSGYARLDYRLRENGQLYLLETNPNPQIARNEDFADSARHAGMPTRSCCRSSLPWASATRPGSDIGLTPSGVPRVSGWPAQLAAGWAPVLSA